MPNPEREDAVEREALAQALAKYQRTGFTGTESDPCFEAGFIAGLRYQPAGSVCDCCERRTQEPVHGPDGVLVCATCALAFATAERCDVATERDDYKAKYIFERKRFEYGGQES